MTEKRPTLVLHPSLPSEQLDFFLTRHRMNPDLFDYLMVEVPEGVQPREAVRDVAKTVSNAVVVVPDDSDLEFYRGADLAVAHVEDARPGYRLVELPDLFPRVDSKLWAEDDTPMLWDREVDARARRDPESVSAPEDADAHRQAIQEADSEGRRPTFRFEHVQMFHGWRPAPKAIGRLAAWAAFRRALPESREPSPHGPHGYAEPTYLWLHNNRILFVGKETPAVSALRDQHDIHSPATFDPLVSAIAGMMARMNPYAIEGNFDRIAPELAAFEEETGLHLEIEIAEVRAMLHEQRGRESLVDGVAARVSPDLDAEVHQLIENLLQREFRAPAEQLGIVFALQAVRRAPLVHLEAPHGELAVIANVGAGNLIQLNAILFPEEYPGPVRLWKEGWSSAEPMYDAGNVRLTVKDLFDKRLEGDVLQSVARRREEAERARRYDDD